MLLRARLLRPDSCPVLVEDSNVLLFSTPSTDACCMLLLSLACLLLLPLT